MTTAPTAKAAPGEQAPAIFTNRFYVQLGDLTRINFLEIVPGGSGTEYPRASLIMDRENAVALAKLILELSEESGGTGSSTGGKLH